MAAASVFVMDLDKAIYDQHTQPMQSHINVGLGSDVTISELANIVGRTVGYQGGISFDTGKPDGSPRKLMSSNCLSNLGWRSNTKLEDGLVMAYHDFLAHRSP
jgi:GDP-L-fucose synthase